MKSSCCKMETPPFPGSRPSPPPPTTQAKMQVVYMRCSVRSGANRQSRNSACRLKRHFCQRIARPRSRHPPSVCTDLV